MGNRVGKSAKRDKRADSILMCGDRLCSLNTITKRCYSSQLTVAAKLHQLADDLDRQEMSMNKARIGLAAIGGTAAAAGFGLSFFTLGASLVLTVVGATIAAASGASAVATSVAEKILQKKTLKEANEAILSYTMAVSEFAPVLEHFCESLSSAAEKTRMRNILTDASIPSSSVVFSGIEADGNLCETCAMGHKIVSTAVRVQEALGLDGLDRSSGKTVAQVAEWSTRLVTEASSFGKEAFTTANSAAKVIRIGGTALVGVGMIIDVGTIVYYSIKVHNKDPSEVAQLIRSIAQAFEDEV